MSERFILFSMPRTGSSMVVSMLATHPDVVCYPALFTSAGWPKGFAVYEAGRTPSEPTSRLLTMPDKWSSEGDRLSSAESYLEELSALGDESRFGFKQHLGRKGNEQTIRLMELRYPAIVLNRSNLLACYASNKIVEITGQGALRVGDDLIPAKAMFEPSEFEKYARRRTEIYAYWEPVLAATGVASMAIEYTEARTLPGMNRIAAFLGVASDRFGEWPTIKRHADDILDRFENTDVAATYLADHGLTHWATEGPDR